ncbi:MAG: hypothetical protein A2175_01540 [Candidatus Nealsonbacteria bacterium RBG_13_42_11]|uniref:STAS/SEC14 domain-containing protein n=1 Tax=Candidatus Nealsonbacteria bacterium RBG_13_42_11 TaxID=1801663 RepID=A0A1G2E158_9BACT|nr:MAG: hypothetical protein A2175_01540 [Candidatus Nealsonbacteria bacterium RBG_13_42_11]
MEEKKHYEGKRFTMDWDPETKIISVVIRGYHRKEDAEEFINKFTEFTDPLPHTALKIMVNGLKMSKSDSAARRMYVNYTKGRFKQRPGVVALCSANLFIRMVGKFVVAVAPGTNFRVFDTPEKGLKWLKSLPN